MKGDPLVLKVFSQNSVLPLLWSRSLTFQLQVVVFREVFKVFPKNGVQQRVLWSRTLTFQFQEVACTVSLFLALQAHPQCRVVCVEKGFFALFPWLKKVRHYLRALGRHCLRTRGHGRRQLMTSPWRSRRSPRRSLTMTLRKWSLMGAGGVRVGPGSPAVLLVGGRGRRIPDWPYDLAAPVAHRAWTRVAD